MNRDAAIEAVTQVFASSVASINSRRPDQPVDVCRFHRELAEDFVDAVLAVPGGPVDGREWTLSHPQGVMELRVSGPGLDGLDGSVVVVSKASRERVEAELVSTRYNEGDLGVALQNVCAERRALQADIELIEQERDAWILVADSAGVEVERLKDALAKADSAFEAIMRAESRAGYLSGPKGIAETAVDQAAVFLHARCLLSEERIVDLIRRASLGRDACYALELPSGVNHQHASPDGGSSPCRRCGQPYDHPAHSRAADHLCKEGTNV